MRSGSSTPSASTPNVSATNAGAYVAKGGDWTPAEEMTRSDLKTGRTGNRTPFQILADYYQTGDTRDRDLWREFSRVTRALRVVRWSRGLRRSILGLDADNELTGEDLAAEDVNGELVAALDTAAWSRLRVAGSTSWCWWPSSVLDAEPGGVNCTSRYSSPLTSASSRAWNRRPWPGPRRRPG